jgi:hypothetical protein
MRIMRSRYKGETASCTAPPDMRSDIGAYTIKKIIAICHERLAGIGRCRARYLIARIVPGISRPSC